MRKIALVLLLVILLAGCSTSSAQDGVEVQSSPKYGKYTSEECQLNWIDMDVETGDEGRIVSIILNNVWAPDSVGYALNECILEGWTGYR